MKTNLLAADIEMFLRLRIPPELLDQAGIMRVTDREARDNFGITGQGDMAGIVFPYYCPVKGHRVTARLRRDNPEIEDGKPKNKYISAYGDRRHLYFAPDRGNWREDSSVPVILVEAEKSVLAIAAWAARTGNKYVPIGTGGCWGWRGRVGKIENAHGDRVDEMGASPELVQFASPGRTAIILLDSNTASNPKVQQAQQALFAQLIKQGADARIAVLPVMDGVNGPDDYIGCSDDAAFEQLVTAAMQKGEKENPDGRKNDSAANRLVAMARRGELFHTSDDVAYATIKIGEHQETWAVKSRTYCEYLCRDFYLTYGTVPNSQAVRDAISIISADARWSGPARQVFVRVAEDEGGIWLDLANPEWHVVRITGTGWQVVKNCPLKFRRPSGMIHLPEPVKGGSIHELRPFINVNDDGWVLLMSWCVAALRPRGPYPILYLTGEHGAAKSTTAAVLRKLVDPHKALHRPPPHDERDLQIAARNSQVISLDNLSRIDPWLSDALCRLATGGGMGRRELYTDAEEIIFEAQRPIILNGIDELAVRGDLLDRCIPITLQAILETARVDERLFWEAFEKARPRILGALLDAVSAALANVNSTNLVRKPRMADFAIWAVAAAPGLGFAPKAFLEAYEVNRRTANETALEASPITPYIVQLVDERAWEGTASELLHEIDQLAAEKNTRRKSWPGSARALSGQLRRIKPNLQSAGITVIFMERTSGKRLIRLAKEAAEPSQPSSSSSSAHGAVLSNDSQSFPPAQLFLAPVRRKYPVDDGCDDHDGLASQFKH